MLRCIDHSFFGLEEYDSSPHFSLDFSQNPSPIKSANSATSMSTWMIAGARRPATVRGNDNRYFSKFYSHRVDEMRIHSCREKNNHDRHRPFATRSHPISRGHESPRRLRSQQGTQDRVSDKGNSGRGWREDRFLTRSFFFISLKM